MTKPKIGKKAFGDPPAEDTRGFDVPIGGFDFARSAPKAVSLPVRNSP